MRRFVLCMVLSVLGSAARGQEPKPAPEAPAPLGLGGSTEKAKLVLNPVGHVGPIKGLFFTPDGTRLVTVGADKTVQFWDVGSGERLKALRLPAFPTAAALSPDGKTLALGRWAKEGEKKVYLVNLDDGRMIWLTGLWPLAGPIPVLAFSPDGDRLAAANAGQGAYLWDGLKGVWERGTAQSPGRGFTATFYIRTLAFSPDSKRIACGCEWGGPGVDISAHVVDLPVGAKKFPGHRLDLPDGNTVGAVAWTPDGQQVVTVPCLNRRTGVDLKATRAAPFWNVANGAVLRRIKLGPRDSSGLHFLNAKELLVTWFDGTGISDAKAGPIGHGQSIFTLTYPPQERKGPFLPGTLEFDASYSALSKDGKLAAFSGGPMGEEVVIWETATGKELHHLGGKLGTPRSVGWSKDGHSLGLGAIGDKEKGLMYQHALDLKEFQLRQKAQASDYLNRVKKSGDWTVLPFPKKYEDWYKLFLKHGDEKLELNAEGLRTAVTLSPAREPAWFAWSTEGEPLVRKGIRLALNLADLRTGKFVKTLLPKNQRVLDLAPSPDGRFLLVATDQPVSRIYRIADDPAKTDPRPLLYLFVSHGDWIMWTTEGYYAANPGGERLMGWQVENGPDKLPSFYPAERFRKRLYRPDVIKLIFEKGSIAEALQTANSALKKQGVAVAEGTADLDQLLPPQAVLRIVDAKNLPKVTLQVTARAASQQQPITALRLLIDGRTATGSEGVVEFPKGVLQAEQTWTITLPGEKVVGAYRLSVLARSRDSSNVSNAVDVAFVNSSKRPAMHVLNVGINEYLDTSLRLQFAAPDARALADAFARSGNKGGLFTKVTANVLTDKDASRDRILKALADMRKNVKSNDLVVISFACHGAKEKDRFYLLTVEADATQLAKTALSGDELRKVLADFPCQVLLLLDACHSAGFGEGRKLAKLGLRPATDDATRALTDDEIGVAVMCAAMGHEKAEEKDGNGLFTKAIVQALSHAQGVPFNRRDHRMYIHHLHTFVFDEVKDRSNDRQHPFLSLPWIVESFPVVQFPGSRN